MRHLLTRLFLITTLLLPIGSAMAYRRSVQPLNIAIVQADAIVVARVTKAPPAHFSSKAAETEVEVDRVFKGSMKSGKLTIRLPEMYVWALGRFKLDDTYIFLLRAAGEAAPVYEVLFDGTRRYTEDDARLIASLVKLSPTWSPPKDGISTVLTASKFQIKPDDNLDLYVGYKNRSEKPITLKYRNWPLEEHTFWSLNATSATGEIINALPHPTVTREDGNEYFAKFPKSYEIVLQPGQAHFAGMERVNSAKQGWGYKEDLDFKYYPMTRPGKYTITATVHNYFDKKTVTTEKLTIWVE